MCDLRAGLKTPVTVPDADADADADEQINRWADEQMSRCADEQMSWCYLDRVLAWLEKSGGRKKWDFNFEGHFHSNKKCAGKV